MTGTLIKDDFIDLYADTERAKEPSKKTEKSRRSSSRTSSKSPPQKPRTSNISLTSKSDSSASIKSDKGDVTKQPRRSSTENAKSPPEMTSTPLTRQQYRGSSLSTSAAGKSQTSRFTSSEPQTLVYKLSRSDSELLLKSVTKSKRLLHSQSSEFASRRSHVDKKKNLTRSQSSRELPLPRKLSRDSNGSDSKYNPNVTFPSRGPSKNSKDDMASQLRKIRKVQEKLSKQSQELLWKLSQQRSSESKHHLT